jgi:hypothetical protein
MEARPDLTAVKPVLRWLVPLLLIVAGSEMLVSRVLAPVPRLGRGAGPAQAAMIRGLADLGTFSLHFALLVAVFLLFLLGIVTRWLRVWPPPLLGWLGVGLSVFSLWSLALSLGPLPDGALYAGFSLLLALAMLMVWFAAARRSGPRAFAVLLGASLACSTFASVGAASGRWDAAARGAAELLALACGALAPALLPWSAPPTDEEARRSFAQAVLAAVPAGLVFFVQAGASRRGPAAWDLGWTAELPLPGALRGLIYGGVTFLFLFALFRGLTEPRWRLQGYGLAFLFLAGVDYSLPYQHVLALIGLVMLTRGALPEEPTGAPAPAGAA